MSLRSLFLMLLVGLSCSSHADTVVTAFGLPLGGKLPYKLKLCSANTETAKEVCWEKAPRIQQGDPTGGIRFPSTDSLPKWAAYGEFWLWQTSQGVLNELTVRVGSGDTKGIEASISSRFGTPTYKNTISGLGRSTYYVDWERSDIKIQMACGESCDLKFISAALAKAREEIFTEMSKKDAARPVAP
jgi:hypothetical protein